MSKSIGVRALGAKIIVERADSETKTPGGLVIPDTAKEKPQRGVVVSVGEGRRQSDGRVVALTLKPGDRILFGRYAGNEIAHGGKQYLVMEDTDVLAILVD